MELWVEDFLREHSEDSYSYEYLARTLTSTLGIENISYLRRAIRNLLKAKIITTVKSGNQKYYKKNE